MPEWTKHLNKDEVALLAEGFDPAKKEHVLLLRLAYERKMAHTFYERWMEAQPSTPLSPAQIEGIQKRVEGLEIRPPCDHDFQPDADEGREFPYLRCTKCQSSTRFLGVL